MQAARSASEAAFKMLEGSAGCKGSNLGSQQACAQHSMRLAAMQHGSSQHLHRHGQTLPPIIKGQPAADLSGNSQDQRSCCPLPCRICCCSRVG